MNTANLEMNVEYQVKEEITPTLAYKWFTEYMRSAENFRFLKGSRAKYASTNDIAQWLMREKQIVVNVSKLGKNLKLAMATNGNISASTQVINKHSTPVYRRVK